MRSGAPRRQRCDKREVDHTVCCRLVTDTAGTSRMGLVHFSQNFSRKCTCRVEHVTDHSPDCESITSNLRNSSRISSTRTILRSKRQPNRTTDACRVGRTWDQHIRITPVNFPIAMSTKIIETARTLTNSSCYCSHHYPNTFKHPIDYAHHQAGEFASSTKC